MINIAVNVLSFAAGFALPEVAAELVALGLFVAAITALGVLPGQRTTNRYGPPPGGSGKFAETFG